MTSETKARQFERTTCSRCSGSGRYSYCQTMNGPFGPYTCFKCVGKGEYLTKRGSAANDVLIKSLSVSLSELKPGDKIRYSSLSSYWVTVDEVYLGTPEKHSSSRVDPLTGERTYGWEIKGHAKDRNGRVVNHGISGLAADTQVRKGHTAEEKAPKIEAALDFQDCLTKTGTIAKRSADKAQEILDRLGVRLEDDRPRVL